MNDNCPYCEQPILPEEDTIYMYFADQQLHLKVHSYHIDGTRNMKKGTDYKTSFEKGSNDAIQTTKH